MLDLKKADRIDNLCRHYLIVDDLVTRAKKSCSDLEAEKFKTRNVMDGAIQKTFTPEEWNESLERLAGLEGDWEFARQVRDGYEAKLKQIGDALRAWLDDCSAPIRLKRHIVQKDMTSRGGARVKKIE